VFVGVAGPEGDLLVRDFLDFVEAELRVEDVVFRLLRERAVLWLADVDLEAAQGVMTRLHDDFAARFPATIGLRLERGFHRVEPGTVPTAKDVLPLLFGPERSHPA
jgi:GGDEF domain-containing protein